ncbi:PqiC family protein [Dyella choica]|uniref:Membrane integrity-associated transporter subunit PqiC n=1 Tax=Dyella choica TaxID=1927959 RepID=A0A3S0WV13_9GAMM|nr:PqiC family protein [Dyella choica]RUL74064.1 membrane integrity-associated transporter subunit PqiC [Dyella choica]
MIRMRHLMAIGGAAALAACASAPVHYYTLVPAPETPAETASTPPNFQFELMPVGVPAQDDVPQLVVREGGQAVTLLNGERWAAPLADEVRGALAVELAQRTHAQDISGAAPTHGKPVLRIKVDLRRFDSAPGSYALIDATWTIRELSSQAVLTCSSRVSESAGPGYAALVAGHQQALATLAGQIAGVAPAMADGRVPECPRG